jgi:hypothetical protein
VELTEQQTEALQNLCKRYDKPFDPTAFKPTFDLPGGYVAGWIGNTIYVGCSPDGRIVS